VVELSPDALATAEVDVVVVQRPEDEVLARQWLGGRVPGRDVPLVWLEHNAPQGRINELRHPAADRDDLSIVHVTPTNALFWDTGTTATRVIEHGVLQPVARWTGELERVAVVVNEPLRRGRVTGTDLVLDLARSFPVDVFGMGARELAEAARAAGCSITPYEDLPQPELHAEVARRRVYFHPYRWTSLGLALIEAMMLGCPVVAVGTLEVPEAVPPEAGVVSTRIDVLGNGLRALLQDPEEAARRGKAARAAARCRYGIGRFLDDWDRLLQEVTA
jgi:glycosyltransferase involved in cell wall biosynthesis